MKSQNAVPHYVTISHIELESYSDMAHDHLLKGHNAQHSGHTGQSFSNGKTLEIQLVRPTEV